MNKISILSAAASATVTMALSFALIACGDDSSSTGPEPITGGESSSSEMALSSEIALSSGGENPASSGGTAGSSSGGDAESSSATAPGFSGTEPESSSAIAPESSAAGSSSSGLNVVAAKDVNAECNDGLENSADSNRVPVPTGASEFVVNMNEIVDGPGATPPVAYKYEEFDDFVLYIVENVTLNCGAKILGINVSAVGDTLFADLRIDPNSLLAKCICDTRISFKIEKNERFSRATSLVVDEDRFNVFRIVPGMYSGTTVETTMQNKVLAGKCLNDVSSASSARALAAVDNGEELPVATLVYDNDFYYLQVENIEANCGIGQAKMVQEMKGDTLFMDYDSSSELLRCMCTFDELKFVVSKENLRANYFSFDEILYKVNTLIIN